MSYAYRYTTEKGGPLQRCPECRTSLVRDGGVEIELTNGKVTWVTRSKLDDSGRLLDPDQEVGEGLHSATLCAFCEETLVDMDGVVEHREET
jgi:hypothetical protein